MILPRDYISYSAASLWYQNKSAFRGKYYLPGALGGISSPQMDFGKEIADMIKDDPENPLVAHIPKYEIRDQGFTVPIEDIPVLMYPDTLSLIGTPKFREYKTSEWVDGKPSWTQKKVDEHMQIKLYSLGIKEQYGAVDDLCHLDWLVTKMEDVTDGIKINGKQYGSTIQLPRMTGDIISFPCVVTEMERYRAREWIVQAAHEIEADYKNFKKNV